MSPNSRRRIPFEPSKKGSKSRKKARSSPSTATARQTHPIPEIVSQRMLTRMGVFSVTPTLLGILTMMASYFIVTKEWFPLPHTVVVLTSLGLFGLGALGLTYGAMSASWEEDKPGSILGIQEFKTNLGRTIAGWRQQKLQQQARQEGGDR